MPLPEIKHPIFKLSIPSTKQTVSYRPYTVQEEKLLLVVRMSEDIDEIIDTLKQIIKNCVLDDINVDKLAMFDIEYIFINIRKVSVSNEVDLFYTDGDLKIPMKVNLDDVKVKFNPEHTDKIAINERLGIKMKYPNLDNMLKIEYSLRAGDFDKKVVDDSVFNMILNCVEYIYDDDKIYNEFTNEELESFVLSLKIEDLKKIQRFFETLPAVEHTVQVRINETETRDVVLRGLKDFFTF